MAAAFRISGLAGGLCFLAACAGAAALPVGVRLQSDVPYGPGPRQRFDVYSPTPASSPAPVLFMVHGGAWTVGDKAMARVVDNKVAHWVPRGVALVSANYPMLPEADALAQVEEVARALAAVQKDAKRWGLDPSRVVLMGHSAGAHLVALLSASPERALRLGARPWLGTVSLDSAALDVPGIMTRRHARFYDDAFGSDPARWRQASPRHQLSAALAPFLAVCSSKRADSCAAADDFVAEARRCCGRAEVLRESLSHREINELLGDLAGYTAAVDHFLASLDPGFAR